MNVDLNCHEKILFYATAPTHVKFWLHPSKQSCSPTPIKVVVGIYGLPISIIVQWALHLHCQQTLSITAIQGLLNAQSPPHLHCWQPWSPYIYALFFHFLLYKLCNCFNHFNIYNLFYIKWLSNYRKKVKIT